jgi:hypothetical protein
LQILDRHEQNLTRPLHEEIVGLRGEVNAATSQRDHAANQLGKISSRVAGFARIIRWGIIIFLLLAAIILLAFAHDLIGESLTQKWGPAAHLTLKIGVYLADAFIILHSIFHVGIWNPVSRLATLVERKLIHLLMQLIGLPIDDGSKP